MNSYTVIILLALIAIAVIRVLAGRLNLQAMSHRIPAAVADVYDGTRYECARNYTRAVTRFGWLSGGLDLLALLVLWVLGAFNSLDVALASFDMHPVLTSLLYIAVIFVAYLMLRLPRSLYFTFVLEERFELNRTTTRSFVLDSIKSILLVLVVGGPLLALLLWLYLMAGATAWLYAWVATTLYLLIVYYVSPSCILPLFNRVTPLAAGPMRDEIMRYTESVRFPLKNILVMDASRRSTRANAVFTSFGKNRRIILYDTLIKQLDKKEVTAVVAHEIGHYRRKHIFLKLLFAVARVGITFFFLSVFVGEVALAKAFSMERITLHGGFVFCAILFAPLNVALSIASNALSRRHEIEADRYAVQTFREPDALISALKKLSASNLVNLTPHPFYVCLHYSHPPLLQRLRCIKRIAREKIPHRQALRFGWRDMF